MYKALRGNAPVYLNVFSNAHNMYALRSVSANQIYVPKPNVEGFRRSFSYSGACAWNELPAKFKECLSLVDFKLKLKEFIFLREAV